MKISSRLWTRIGSASLATMIGIHTAAAQVFDGPGLLGGLDAAGGIEGLPDGDVRNTIIRILNVVLSYLALAAVIVIIIAGIRLIVSLGNDDEKEKAKKIIFYALAGLIIVLFARVIVGLVTVYLAGQLS